MDSLVRRLSAALCPQLTGQGLELEVPLTLLADALCELRCPEAILGLATWSLLTTGKSLSWLSSVAVQAAGR